MDRIDINGVTLEYEDQGSGEPVVFIHGAHIGDTYKPLVAEPALRDYRLIRYHRRGYGNSSPPASALSVSDHAADCLALLRKLDALPANVVGHSSGGAIALQVALDGPDAVRSLALLEPALLDVPSGAALFEALGPSVQKYQGGDRAGAVDSFLQAVCGKDYRLNAESRLPGALEQATRDADSFFGGEFPAIGQWTFTRQDAARINQPVLAVLGADSESTIGLPVFNEIHERVLEWMPNAKPFILPGAAHLLQVENPRGMAEGLSAFLAAN
jgi:pimeloyl-ACP methyl ester carboxylesterase